MGDFYVKTGSSWQLVDTPYVKVGGSWQPCTNVYVKTGGSWQEVWASGGSVSVQLTAQNLVRLTTQECYSGIKIDSDGGIYTKDAAGSSTWTDSGDNWLLSGANSDVWVEASYSAGTGSPSLFSSSATGTRLSCAGDRFWMIRDTTDGGGEVTGTLDLYLYDASSGGNLLASRQYALDAEYLFFG